MTVYSVCVGKYPTLKDSKQDEKILRNYGLTIYPFSTSDGYTLKVLTTPLKEKAELLRNGLKSKGFDAFVTD